MADQPFVDALDTQYDPARKVKVPANWLEIFPNLKPRTTKRDNTPKPAPAADKTADPKGGK